MEYIIIAIALWCNKPLNMESTKQCRISLSNCLYKVYHQNYPTSRDIREAEVKCYMEEIK